MEKIENNLSSIDFVGTFIITTEAAYECVQLAMLIFVQTNCYRRLLFAIFHIVGEMHFGRRQNLRITSHADDNGRHHRRFSRSIRANQNVQFLARVNRRFGKCDEIHNIDRVNFSRQRNIGVGRRLDLFRNTCNITVAFRRHRNGGLTKHANLANCLLC